MTARITSTDPNYRQQLLQQALMAGLIAQDWPAQQQIQIEGPEAQVRQFVASAQITWPAQVNYF